MPTLSDLLSARLYTELAERTGWVWDVSSARYISLTTGRYTSEGTIRAVGEKFILASIETNIDRLTQQFLDGKIDLATWQQRMAKEIKDAHRLEVFIGRGGRPQMTQQDWGRLGARLREQYRHLNRFAEDIKAGRCSVAEIRSRAKMYARSARTSYFDGLTAAKAEAGFSEEMRVLGDAEHCADCPPISDYWAPIGSLPPIGESACLTNCRCTKIFRKTVIDESGETIEVIG